MSSFSFPDILAACYLSTLSIIPFESNFYLGLMVVSLMVGIIIQIQFQPNYPEKNVTHMIHISKGKRNERIKC